MCWINPEAEGGLGQYTLAGSGPVPSIVSNLSAYVITNMLAGSVELAMCGLVIQETFLKGGSIQLFTTFPYLIFHITLYVDYRSSNT